MAQSYDITPRQELLNDPAIHFMPSEGLDEWARDLFVSEDAKLFNPEHSHLQFAEIGWLWTTCANTSKGRRVLGMAEIFSSRENKWKTARQEQQIIQWFEQIPDFIITIDATYWIETGNPERFALIEHELYHCAQATDKFGAPRFNQSTGRPVFTIRGHDVEEFVGVVQRYGAETAGVSEMVKAANKGPEIAPAKVDGLCGTCSREVA